MKLSSKRKASLIKAVRANGRMSKATKAKIVKKLHGRPKKAWWGSKIVHAVEKWAKPVAQFALPMACGMAGSAAGTAVGGPVGGFVGFAGGAQVCSSLIEAV